MARVTGFLVQALLVALSFWLNASHNTDAIRCGVPGVVAIPATSAAPEEKAPTLYDSNDESGRALNAGAESDESTPSVDQAEEEAGSDEAVMNSTNAVDLAREEEMKVDESVSPKGGKLVSIPSVEVDALRGRRAADDRIIGVTKAELDGIVPNRANGR